MNFFWNIDFNELKQWSTLTGLNLKKIKPFSQVLNCYATVKNYLFFHHRPLFLVSQSVVGRSIIWILEDESHSHCCSCCHPCSGYHRAAQRFPDSKSLWPGNEITWEMRNQHRRSGLCQLRRWKLPIKVLSRVKACRRGWARLRKDSILRRSIGYSMLKLSHEIFCQPRCEKYRRFRYVSFWCGFTFIKWTYFYFNYKYFG